jgi:hypothetical protein
MLSLTFDEGELVVDVAAREPAEAVAEAEPSVGVVVEAFGAAGFADASGWTKTTVSEPVFALG